MFSEVLIIRKVCHIICGYEVIYMKQNWVSIETCCEKAHSEGLYLREGSREKLIHVVQKTLHLYFDYHQFSGIDQLFF